MKKTTLVIATTLVILLGLKLIFEVDLRETFKTKYLLSKVENQQIIETAFFKIRTPKGWIHIASGFGVEGDPYGYFLTKKGKINYEYGFFGPDYAEDSAAEQYKTQKVIAGRFEVTIASDKTGETGITIWPQHEMNRGMTFYMGEAVTDNLPEIIAGINHMQFKKR